ncbi:TBC1 domain family member 20-like isoform X1 [Engystomops pustulosus]|uniref:TBC1 domain family member 20-like isoform X1 n=1 Tax=Engystomops pustulosus TaxID=76066 RepID=UPI003AFAFBCB
MVAVWMESSGGSCWRKSKEAAMTGAEKRRRTPGAGGARSLSWRKQKSLQIHEALTHDPVDVETLRDAALGEGGLLTPEIRRRVWPKLLSINVFCLPPKPGPALRAGHCDYNQVLMDVRRSLKRFPKGMTDVERSVLQEQLIDMILYVLHTHPELHYYQGFHDVAVTLLLTVGLRLGTAMLQTLSTHHLRDFMDPTMERTRSVLSYLMPLIQSECPALHDFLLRCAVQMGLGAQEFGALDGGGYKIDLARSLTTTAVVCRSEVGCIFALSWLITWYGHVLSDFHQVLRLYDFFLASHPLMPVYCAAQMVLMREREVLQCDCDMASVHQLLSRIPSNFPYETLITRTHSFFQRRPPSQLERQTSLQRLKSISAASFRSLQISSAQQRPDSVLRQQVAPPSDVLPARSPNTLVKLAVWGISASLGAAALAVTQTALEWGPDLLLGLF